MHDRDQQALDRRLEAETIIRWDETGDPAVLWTASRQVRRDWQGYGFPVTPDGRGWRAEVPAHRISYKPLQKR